MRIFIVSLGIFFLAACSSIEPVATVDRSGLGDSPIAKKIYPSLLVGSEALIDRNTSILLAENGILENHHPVSEMKALGFSCKEEQEDEKFTICNYSGIIKFGLNSVNNELKKKNQSSILVEVVVDWSKNPVNISSTIIKKYTVIE